MVNERKLVDTRCNRKNCCKKGNIKLMTQTFIIFPSILFVGNFPLQYLYLENYLFCIVFFLNHHNSDLLVRLQQTIKKKH